MYAHQFWWAWPLWFRRSFPFFICLQNGQDFPSNHGLQSMRVKKQNWLKKFMQVEVDEICMCTMFGGLPNIGPGITRDNDNNYCYCSHLSFPCGQNTQVFLSSSHPFPEHLVSYHNTTSCLLGSCPSSPLIHSVILSHSPLLKIFCCLSHIFT